MDACTYLDTSMKGSKQCLTFSSSVSTLTDTCFVLDNDGQCFTVSTNLKCSGTDCSLPFLCFIDRTNAPFIAQIKECIYYVYHVFAVVDDDNISECLE